MPLPGLWAGGGDLRGRYVPEPVAVMPETVWARIGCDHRPNVGERSRFMGRE